MVGLEEGVLPHARINESMDESDLEEERRLMYVGMTRAREELHICYADSRLQFGNRMYNPVSRFVGDMDVDSEETPRQFASTITKESDIYYSDIPFSVGDRVKSAAFGEGTVQDVDGMAISIKFKNGQTKMLNIEFARLEKLS